MRRVLLELDYAQAFAADKESVDAEGALIAPAAATVKDLWPAALDVVFLPNTEIMSHDSGDLLVDLGTRQHAERLCLWREARDLPRPKLANCSE